MKLANNICFKMWLILYLQKKTIQQQEKKSWKHLSITLLYNNIIQTKLHLCTFHNSLLHSVFCDETEYMDLLPLTNSVSSIL